MNLKAAALSFVMMGQRQNVWAQDPLFVADTEQARYQVARARRRYGYALGY